MKSTSLGLLGFGASVLYLYSIKTRLFQRPDYTEFKGKYFAHRGLHNMSPLLKEMNSPYYCHGGKFPENSVSAIKRAVEEGYGIEFDVHLTKDHIPVVFHDDTLERLCGVTKHLKDFTFDELQQFHLYDTEESIPSLEEILTIVNGKVPLIIELKEENNAEELCTICNRYLSNYTGYYCIESFHPKVVRWYRIHRPDVIRGQLSEDFTKEKMKPSYFLMSHLIGNCYGSPDFVAYNCKHYKELSRRICKTIYRSPAFAWTVRSQDELAQIQKHFDSYIFENFLPNDMK